MASVSSLDNDVRNMRLSKYTPKAANEVKGWIEETLGERLEAGDLLDSLKDGVALCKLVNLVLPPPGVKYKNSKMPFVQMENISLFLRAIQLPPMNLQPHDVFLTVDLYEYKDPAQVIQCLGAFSRVANAAQPSKFRRTIGPKSRNSAMSPQGTGMSSGPGIPASPDTPRARGTSTTSQDSSSWKMPPRTTALSPNLTGSSNSSKATTSTNGTTSHNGPVSSWSRKADEGATAPAWNIHQYGYMGGASQGNQGISFGARRQITSAAPVVPNMADKQRQRREQEAEEERLRLREEEERKSQKQAEEERERIAEEERWAQETRKQREHELELAEMEKKKWLEQEARWKAEELKREAEARSTPDRSLNRQGSDTLKGQYLSQYRKDQDGAQKLGELTRVQELELELEKARERERAYEEERQRNHTKKGLEHHDLSTRMKQSDSHSRPRSEHRLEDHTQHREDDWREKERNYLRQNWGKHHNELFGTTQSHTPQPPRPLPEPTPSSNAPPVRPLPDPDHISKATSPRPLPEPTSMDGPSSRPLPDPATYSSNRTDRYLSENPAPKQQAPQTYFPSEVGAFDSSAERHAEDSRREASQTKTKAGKWAASSLLEKEMERERLRQQEWEQGQQSTKEAGERGVGRGSKEGTIGPGGNWDVNQFGYTSGDSQNRGGVGLGGRRQIIGPRPLP